MVQQLLIGCIAICEGIHMKEAIDILVPAKSDFELKAK
jgi:hypothetical protein